VALELKAIRFFDRMAVSVDQIPTLRAQPGLAVGHPGVTVGLAEKTTQAHPHSVSRKRPPFYFQKACLRMPAQDKITTEQGSMPNKDI
jgi:hypothetical protein